MAEQQISLAASYSNTTLDAALLLWRRAVEAPPTMPQHNPLLDRDLHCEDAAPP